MYIMYVLFEIYVSLKVCLFLFIPLKPWNGVQKETFSYIHMNMLHKE